MPTYEYKCLKCGKKFDYFQKMSDKVLTQCIHCKGKVERLIGAGAGLIFKGTGFYETDYKRKSDSSGASKAANSSGGTKSGKKKKGSD
jgi:putative FmdB family regulatory protein